MIRFSAALVAVAIGVLIGGIATSKLLLVYIAIAASAAALVALAIGVVLKREELFGEGQGLVPAPAGAVPGGSASVGADHGQRPNGYASPPLLQGAAAGPGAAFAAGHGPAVSAQPGVSWGTQAASGAWPSPGSPTQAVPAAWQAPPVPPGATVGGWGVPTASETASEPAAQEAPATRAWGRQAPSAFAPPATEAPPVTEPPAASGTEPESGLPNWFNPADRPGEASRPAAESKGGWSWPDNDGPAVPRDQAAEATATPDEDDDWPARYSWLEDEPEESESTAAPLTSLPAQDPVTAKAVAEPANPATNDTGVGDGAHPAPLRLVRDPDPAAEAPEAVGLTAADGPSAAPGSPEPDGKPVEPVEAGDQPAGTGLVTVIRGVPRFHTEDCVLIRFMPEGDTQKLTVAQAKEAGCTPCAACQPEE